MEEWIRYRGKIYLFREVNEIKAYRDRSQRSISEKRYATDEHPDKFCDQQRGIGALL